MNEDIEKLINASLKVDFIPSLGSLRIPGGDMVAPWTALLFLILL